ncbi:MAG: stage 0 sporulation protein [Prevotella sp.]|nr:stage 0 sporulation protein [Staphylococcus sp.]MCM1350727.1 stage 0 sporulation protein [Prevotella sp.]
MKTVVGIQFKGGGRVYYFDPLDNPFSRGDHAIVETVRGLELGFVSIGNREIEDDQLEHELKPVIRRATEEDIRQEEKNNELAKKSFETFKQLVKEFDLDMKPLYCEYTIDSSKVIFYYSAEDRVDFRELLKVLAPKFRIRVELRQIGTREAARVIGGVGSCGRELCCKTHLSNFDFVTMKMAKEQGMALNTNKISGICDKLMCCIAYEHELYQELKKELPNVGQMVKTPSCNCCKVVSVDYMKKIVRTNENPSGAPTAHPANEVEIIDFSKEVRDDAKVVVTIPKEVKGKEREIIILEEEKSDEFETKSVTLEETNSSNDSKEKKNHHKNQKHYKGKKPNAKRQSRDSE